MFGFNWIDVIILGLLIGAIVGGRKIGFLTQFGIIGGFFGALSLAGWLFPRLLPIDDPTLLTLVNANLVLITATYAGIKGFDLGSYLHRRLRTKLRWLKPYEAWLGAIPGTMATLILVWLLAAAIGRLPFAGLSNSVNDALIVQRLNRLLPSVPSVLATFNNVVDPNALPYVFAQPKPQTDFNFSEAEVRSAIQAASQSIVRITSFGCGGLITGSGFVAGPDLVITNAHVIAGAERPIVKYDNHSFETVPVVFDANLDFAVLRVQHNAAQSFSASPLQLTKQSVATGTTVAVLGYPAGNYSEQPGIIRNDLTVFGRNIYDLGVIGRGVYEIQTSAGQGSSGGPVVIQDGSVAGVIFALSDEVDNYAYALNASYLIDKLTQATTAYRRVSTGVCLGG